ncbi:Zinc finger protein JAGGED [Glycine soja]|nr:Zinc finger protein JAGGED [Glycine soja]
MTLLFLYRRPERNPLDLNNLPDEYSRDGKQVLEDHTSSSERETETLNQARQLVFRCDHNIAAQGAPHLGCCQTIGTGGYHPSGDPTVPLRFPRYFSGSSSTHMPPSPPPPPPPPPPPQRPYLYPSPTRPVSFGSSHFPLQHAVNDYYVGHVMSGGSHGHYVGGESTRSYTCIGAPVGQGGGFAGGKEGSAVQEEGLSTWGRGYSGAQDRLDPPSAINRFQDGF